MLRASHPTLEDQVIELLAEGGPLRVEELMKRVRPAVSRQAIYLTLRKLIAQGVAIKTGRAYGLKVTWAEELRLLGERAVRQAAAGLEVPLSGTQRWQFTSLVPALNFWTHLTALLLERSTARVLLEWAPHAWFHLVISGAEEQFQRMLDHKGSRYYLCVGHETALDKSYAPFFRAPRREVSYAESPFHGTAFYFSVIGSSLIKVTFPAAYSERLSREFASHRTANLQSVLSAQRLLNQPVKIQMAMFHDVPKTKRIRRQFADFFGFPAAA